MPNENREMFTDRKPASNRNMNDAMRPTPLHLLTEDEYRNRLQEAYVHIWDLLNGAPDSDSGKPLTHLDILHHTIASLSSQKTAKFDYDQYMFLVKDQNEVGMWIRENMTEQLEAGDHEKFKSVSSIAIHYMTQWKNQTRTIKSFETSSIWSRLWAAVDGRL
jgi:hypothetical protein